MRIEIGKILKSFIGKNLDSTVETQLFQTELSEQGDGQTVEELHIPGLQYQPRSESRPFVARITGAWKICLGIDDFVEKESLSEGERLLYSDDSGTIAARVRLSPDGKTAIGDLTKPMISTPPQLGIELLELIDRFMLLLSGTINKAGAQSETTLLPVVTAEILKIRTDLGNIKGTL